MMNKRLDIGIPCGNNSDFFVNFLLDNIVKTKSNNVDIKVILGINNYDTFDVKVIEKFDSYFETELFYVKTDTEPGAVGHALTLSAILERMDSEVGMFLDVDTAFLVKDWDEVFSQEITDKYVAFGTAYVNPRKYQNFPMLTACSFNTPIVKSLNIDFRPLMDPPDSKYIVKTEIEARAWGKSIGEQVVLDCGYKFPLRVIEAGYEGKIIPYCGTGKLGIGQEFHRNGLPFMTHMKGSSTCNEKHPTTVQWTKSITNYLKSRSIA